MSDNAKPWASVNSFLADSNYLMASLNQNSNTSNNHYVRILSLQAVKGLEADIVCIVGLEENSILFNTEQTENIEDKARTLFVAMTRAKKELHLFHCRNRSGSATYHTQPHGLKPSNFLSVLPKDKYINSYHKAQ